MALSLRTQILVILDTVIPAGIAMHVWMKCAVWDVVDTDPPRCENQYGEALSCSTSELLVMGAALAVFGVLTFGAFCIQRRRGWI